VTAPLIGPTTLAMLQRAGRAALVDEATLESQMTERIPGSAGQYHTFWITRARPEPARLRPAGGGGTGATALDQAADAGDWVLELTPGSPVAPGDRAMVRGVTRSHAGPVRWQRLVRVKYPSAPTADETVRSCLVRDEELQIA
jgi:hypothetical protein